MKKRWIAIIIVVLVAVVLGVWLVGIHGGNTYVVSMDRINAERWVEDDASLYDFALEKDVADLKLNFLSGCEVYKGEVEITLENDAGEIFYTIDGRQQMNAKDNVVWVGALKKGNYRFVAHVTEDATFAMTVMVQEYLHGYQYLY